MSSSQMFILELGHRWESSRWFGPLRGREVEAVAVVEAAAAVEAVVEAAAAAAVAAAAQEEDGGIEDRRCSDANRECAQMQIEISSLAVNLNYSSLNDGLGARPLI
jgi:hypothetical protein